MEPGTRKLFAIMFSDIAGYTALMGEDEDRAVRALERSRLVTRTQDEPDIGLLQMTALLTVVILRRGRFLRDRNREDL